MKVITYITTLTLMFSLASVTLAEDGKAWKDEAQLSFVKTGGNTEVTILSANTPLPSPKKHAFHNPWNICTLLITATIIISIPKRR